MVTPYEANKEGARMARKLAEICLSEGKIEEAKRHNERADFYEFHAALYAPKIKQEIAA